MTVRALLPFLVALGAAGCRSEAPPDPDPDRDPEPAPATANDAGLPIAPSTPCGFAGAACCVTTTPCDTRSQCIAGRCEPCGDLRQSCCPGDSCVSPLTCSAGSCTPCGRVGEACCTGAAACFAGLVCNTAFTCANF